VGPECKEKKPIKKSKLKLAGTTANRLANDIGFLFQCLVRMVLFQKKIEPPGTGIL
jgi:hypothetical protein